MASKEEDRTGRTVGAGESEHNNIRIYTWYDVPKASGGTYVKITAQHHISILATTVPYCKLSALPSVRKLVDPTAMVSPSITHDDILLMPSFHTKHARTRRYTHETKGALPFVHQPVGAVCANKTPHPPTRSRSFLHFFFLRLVVAITGWSW